jgi:hypothetical protein
LTTTAYRNGSYLGKVFEFDPAKGSFNIIFPDGVAAANPKGEILYFDKTSRIKITDRTGNTTLKQLSDTINYNFNDFYPAISNSGEFVALTVPNKSKTGTLADMAANGVKIVILDRNGQGVAEFKGYTQAAWISDGQLVAAGDGNNNKGLFIIDRNFKSVNKITEGYENAQMPAVSPDGKRLAFSNNGEIWLINLDGTNASKIIFGNESLFPAWSPDQKFIAVNMKVKLVGVDRSLMYVFNLKSEQGFYLKDSNGNHVESRNRITWLPNNTNASGNLTNNPPKKVSDNQVAAQKIKADSATVFKPAINNDSRFSKAFDLYKQTMADDFEEFNDVAAAFTYIIAVNYSFKKRQESIPTNQIQKIYRQFVEKLLQIEGFKSASNEAKQQLAESAIMDGLETYVTVNTKDQNKINEVTLRIMRKYIGNKADTLVITDNGMEF